MVRAWHVLSSCDWSSRPADDVITLDYDSRHRRRLALTADGGTAFLLDLPRATVLQQDDGLALEDGRRIRVAAAAEPVMAVYPGRGVSLARLAWHVGNRHLPAVIGETQLLLREDHVIAAMLEGLGARIGHVRAPFTPEQGAYSGGHGHTHDHDHTHEHRHGHNRGPAPDHDEHPHRHDAPHGHEAGHGPDRGDHQDGPAHNHGPAHAHGPLGAHRPDAV